MSPATATAAATATYAVEAGLTVTVANLDVPHTVSLRLVERRA